MPPRSWFDRFSALYSLLIKWTSNLQSIFLFWMRLTWGPQFFVMGMQRLTDLGQSIETFTSLGFSNPLFHTYLVGYIELIGGIALIAGLGSRLFTIPLVITTLTILTRAHGSPVSEWKLLTHPSLISHQPPYPFLIVALLILIFSPGKLSIDGWIKRRLQKKNLE